MKLTRKELLGGAAAGALGAAGIYKLVDELVESPPRAEAGELREEQYLLSGMKLLTAEHPPIGRAYVPTGSYAEMGEWSLPSDESRAYSAALHHAVEEDLPVT